jgi:hypothetical protein
METNNQLKAYGSGFKRNLVAAIREANIRSVNAELKAYNLKNTPEANYVALLSIPSTDRLPAMAEQDFATTDAIVTVALTMAMENMNLARPMSSNQLMNLSAAIIDTAAEDNRALEDLRIFLQKLVRGEYGSNYESMDIPKFMSKFEEYRQERHQSMIRIREEQHAQHKALPVDDRYSEAISEGEKQKHREAAIGDLIQRAIKNNGK